MPFQQLPWMVGPERFLQAIMAGADDRARRDQMEQQARSEADRLALGYANLNANRETDLARIAASQTGRESLNDYREAQLENARVRNELAQERLRKGSPLQAIGLGRGGLALFNPNDGSFQEVRERDPSTADEPRISDVDTADVDPSMAQAIRMFNPRRISGPASVVEKYLSRPASATKIVPPKSAVDHLLKNPTLAEQFDAKYGAGASTAILQNALP